MTPHEAARFASSRFGEESKIIIARRDLTRDERETITDARVGVWFKWMNQIKADENAPPPGPLVLPPLRPLVPWDPSHREIL